MRHHLSNPTRKGRVYRANCECGLAIWGHTLPRLWTAHQIHLNAARALQ